MGDYYTALKVLEHVELGKKVLDMAKFAPRSFHVFKKNYHLSLAISGYQQLSIAITFLIQAIKTKYYYKNINIT